MLVPLLVTEYSDYTSHKCSALNVRVESINKLLLFFIGLLTTLYLLVSFAYKSFSVFTSKNLCPTYELWFRIVTCCFNVKFDKWSVLDWVDCFSIQLWQPDHFFLLHWIGKKSIAIFFYTGSGEKAGSGEYFVPTFRGYYMASDWHWIVGTTVALMNLKS